MKIETNSLGGMGTAIVLTPIRPKKQKKEKKGGNDAKNK